MRSKKNMILFLLLVLLVLAAGYFVFTYNRLVQQEEGVKLAWNEMQNVYKRRLDLVPSLVGIVKGTAAYEQQILTQIAAARSKAGTLQFSGNNVSYNEYRQQEAVQKELAISMSRLMAVVEAYPDLKGTKSFLYLQTQLEGTERRIKVARKDFNEAVNLYNTSCRKFPSSLVAGIAGFKVRAGFQAWEGAETATDVKF